MFAKKSLGQNFLKSKAALRAMIEAGNIQLDDQVLEVGPGKGALTSALLEAGACVIALEKDSRLIEPLQEKFQKEISAGKLKIISADALEFDPATLSSISPASADGKYKIVANIPYYITGQFFRIYLTHKNQPQKMVIMVQKEVAQRIATKDSKESLLSLSIKCYGTPKYVMTVQKKYFSPEPKVDSAVILIDNISREFFENISEEKYFELLKAGFAHKRKVLISNLTSIAPREKLQEVFAKLNLSEKIRAEDTNLADWKNLAQELF